jgi:hypothetical protein
MFSRLCFDVQDLYQKNVQNGKYNAKLKKVPQKFSPGFSENDEKISRHGISVRD